MKVDALCVYLDLSCTVLEEWRRLFLREWSSLLFLKLTIVSAW